MRRLFAFCIVIGAFFLSTSIAETAATNGTIAVGGDSAALGADQTLQQHLKKKDAKSAGTLLDQDFSWTNEKGQTRRKTQFLKDAAAGSTDSDTEYMDTKAREYGQLAVVTGTSVQQNKDRTFFARVWVKRPGGWDAAHASGHGHRREGFSKSSAARSRKQPARCNGLRKSMPYSSV